LDQRESQIRHELSEWELELLNHRANDFEMTYNKWMERGFESIHPKIRSKIFSTLDTWIFHLHAFIQGSQTQLDARRRLINEGRLLNENIEQLSDLNMLSIDQLSYLAEQQMAKYRTYALAQGGLTGTGGILLLGIDIPAVTILNLRAVQLVSMTYGYDVNVPYEMMTSLKVFHAATLPKRLQADALAQLKEDIIESSQVYFYEGNDELTDVTWVEHPLKQILKGTCILLFRKKLIQGLPLISMAVGAGLNYQLTKQVTEFAHKFYQMRYLQDKYL
jgi:hypothetical protein